MTYIVKSPIIDGRRRCTNCHVTKPIEDFYKKCPQGSGRVKHRNPPPIPSMYMSECKDCFKERQLQRRLDAGQKMSTDWYVHAQRYLHRLGALEYQVGLAAHVKQRRSPKTYHHDPSQYHRNLVELLHRNDEEGFKALKGEQGYASVLKL